MRSRAPPALSAGAATPGAKLGDGTTADSPIPVEVKGLGAGVTAVAAGSDHACAVLYSGGIDCWGANDAGQLGDGTSTDSAVPVTVSGLAAGVTAVAVGERHTCALLNSGGVECRGTQLGELGTEPSILGASTTPVGVSGLGFDVTQLVAGWYHTCALTGAGAVKCWGDNSDAQLGDGNGGYGKYSATPVDVPGLQGGVKALAAGDEHTCALTTAGGLKCWPLLNPTQTPVDVPGLTGVVLAVALGGFHSCAVMAGGGVKCWGSSNDQGELGSPSDGKTPADVAGLANVQAVAAGEGPDLCALTTVGRVMCWGGNLSGELGGRYLRLDSCRGRHGRS